jgi:endoglucanase
MKNKLFFIGFFLTTLFSSGQWLKADGKNIVNSNGEEVLLRGIGPGGWQVMEGYMMNTSGVAGSQHEIKEKLIDLMGTENTETFFNKWRENHFTKRDVDSMAAWGYNSIRIPMHYNLFTLPIEEEPVSGQNTWIETGFELIDNVLEWSAPHDIYVILDMHAAPGGQGTGSEINDYDPAKPSLWESQENRNKLVALWTRIAQRYKDNAWIGGYDLINETHWDLGNNNALLREIFEDITAGIRGVGDEHILYIEGNSYANDHRGLTPPWDDNLVYSFHKYWNFNNTNDVDWILPLREQHNVPLWMGESGENSNTWFTDAISLFENNNIGWAWWTMRKIGDIDSPYAVDINPGYQKILDYWKGQGSKPTSQETFDGMMQLCENLLVDNSRYRKDVPDACIRQVQTDETKPYHGTPFAIPGLVYMADFDLGKNKFAYYDTNVADYNLSTGEFQAWNSGWSYRNDGVDIEKNTDNTNSNGFHVGFVNNGEWMKYTVNINETAAYKANIRVASKENGGAFFLSMDDQEITTVQMVSSTGDWSTFTTIEVLDIILEEGEHSLKFHISNDTPFNISSIEFEKTGTVNALALNALNGKTGTNEKSIEIAISEALSATSLDETIGDFTVHVNGEERSISSVNSDLIRDKLIVLTMDQFLIKSDVIAVSYLGTSIQSESNKTLDTFTDLPIVNESPNRKIIPGRIEMEDYDYMIGMALEDSNDEGGGKNLGYTNPGDYADYSIYVPNSGDYGISLRVASLFSAGKIGLYSVDKNEIETELTIINTVITGGWQNWQTVTNSMFIEEGPHTLRMKILEGEFNINWMEFGAPDADGDGVLDPVDNCPNTPENVRVDIHGCPLFSIPSTNYTIAVFSETCSYQNNGRIQLSASENYNYTAVLTGNENAQTKTFSSEALVFDGLSAGVYDLCMTIDEKQDYEQCFAVVIIEPDALVVSANKNDFSKKVAISLQGGSSYYITLNEEVYITPESDIELPLRPGENKLSVKTEKECQGVFSKTIRVTTEPIVYPNPITDNTLFIGSLGIHKVASRIQLFDIKGKLVHSEKCDTNALKIDLSHLENGMYAIRITTATESFNYKIIKK